MLHCRCLIEGSTERVIVFDSRRLLELAVHSDALSCVILVHRIFTTGQEVGDTLPKLILDDLVSQHELLLQVLDNVVSLLDVELGAVLFSLNVDLLHVKLMLFLEHFGLGPAWRPRVGISGSNLVC